jgi:hypothetical protein
VGRGLGVGATLGVGVTLGVAVGVAVAVVVGVGVAVAVGVAEAVAVGVGVGLSAAAQYLPPVFSVMLGWWPASCGRAVGVAATFPPQTIISLPVHTAV